MGLAELGILAEVFVRGGHLQATNLLAPQLSNGPQSIHGPGTTENRTLQMELQRIRSRAEHVSMNFVVIVFFEAFGILLLFYRGRQVVKLRVLNFVKVVHQGKRFGLKALFFVVDAPEFIHFWSASLNIFELH